MRIDFFKIGRYIIYIIAISFFIFVLLKEFHIIYYIPTLEDIEKAYFSKDYQKVVKLSSLVAVKNKKEKSKLNSYLAKSYLNLYSQIKEKKLLYNSCKFLTKISSQNLLKESLKYSLEFLQSNEEKKAELMYCYIRKRMKISSWEVDTILTYSSLSLAYKDIMKLLLAKTTSRKHLIFYQLSKIYNNQREFLKALRSLRIARGLSPTKEFLSQTLSFLAVLNVQVNNCKVANLLLEKLIGENKFSEYHLYKFYCDYLNNKLDYLKVAPFLKSAKIQSDDVAFFLLKEFFTLKLHLFNQDYENALFALNNALAIGTSQDMFVTPEILISEIIKHFTSYAIEKKYVKKLILFLLQNNAQFTPVYFQNLIKTFIVPNLKVFSSAQKRKIFPKLINIIEKNRGGYYHDIHKLADFYYLLAYFNYRMHNYSKVEQYVKEYLMLFPAETYDSVVLYRLLVKSYFRLKDYHKIEKLTNQAIEAFSKMPSIKIDFYLYKLKALKKIDRRRFIKELVALLKDDSIDLKSKAYKYMLNEYLWILFDKAARARLFVDNLKWWDTIIYYKKAYEQLYNEVNVKLNNALLQAVLTYSTLKHCKRIEYYMDAFSISLTPRILDNARENFYKYIFCMYKTKNGKKVISLLEKISLDSAFSEVDRFLSSAFLFLITKTEEQFKSLANKYFFLSKKMFRMLNSDALSMYEDRPYNPKRVGELINAQ